MAGDVEQDEFYLQYYVGHKGKFGHEFLEFEFHLDSKLYYTNNSNYKNDTIIRKEVFLTLIVLIECRRIIINNEENDNSWPEPNRAGRMELEIIMGNEHISFPTSKIRSPVDVHSGKDPDDLCIFYYLVQKLRIISRQLGLDNLGNLREAVPKGVGGTTPSAIEKGGDED